jgi:hypothetical protein
MSNLTDGILSAEENHLEFLTRLIEELDVMVGSENIPDFIRWELEQTETLIGKCGGGR